MVLLHFEDNCPRVMTFNLDAIFDGSNPKIECARICFIQIRYRGSINRSSHVLASIPNILWRHDWNILLILITTGHASRFHTTEKLLLGTKIIKYGGECLGRSIVQPVGYSIEIWDTGPCCDSIRQ